MTTKCCKCDRIRLNGGWIQRISAGDKAFSYTYCPSCLREFRREVWRERRAERLQFTTQPQAI